MTVNFHQNPFKGTEIIKHFNESLIFLWSYDVRHQFKVINL